MNEGDESGDVQTSVLPPVDFTVGNFVAGVYEGQWYAGKIVELDDDEEEEEEEVEIDFLERATTQVAGWKWPNKRDAMFITKNDVICNIKEPQTSGRGKRIFHLNDEDKYKIEVFMATKM